LGVDQITLAPESNFGDLIIEGINAEIDLFLGISVNLKLKRANGDLSIGISGSVQSEAKDVFG
jgi:hypothetical protein